MRIRNLFHGRVKSDMSLTYLGGMQVRRVERGRRVEWLLDGEPVTEQIARECMRAKEQELQAGRP
jgi:hypothetical protein